MRTGAFELSYQVGNNPMGRQLVIPDIHGCSKTFKRLLKRINLQKSDHLFLLGDYINKGPDGAGVLDIILDLIERGFQIFPLRGNHEQMLLDSHHRANGDFSVRGLPSLTKSVGLRDGNGHIFSKYLPFIQNLPYFYELQDYYIVHAGFNLEHQYPLRDFETMLWTKEFKGDLARTKNKTVVIGHVPTNIQFIYQSLAQKSALIRLDNGCVYKTKWFLGYLVCLDLNAKTITPQPNIE